MNRRRLWVMLLVVVMVLAAGAIGLVARPDLAEKRDADAAIREQKRVLEEVRTERVKLREKIDDAAKAIRELPDSLSGSKSGRALKTAVETGKEELVLDQRQSRAEKRLRFQTDRSEAARRRLVKWVGTLALAEIILLFAALAVGRRLGRARTA